MSTYWDLYCTTCNEYADIDINHGDSVLLMALQVYPHVRSLLDMDKTGYLEVHIMGYGEAPFDFLREHDGHTVQVKSEYGKVASLEKEE